MFPSSAVGRAIGRTPGASRWKYGRTCNTPDKCSNASASRSTKPRRIRKMPGRERSGGAVLGAPDSGPEHGGGDEAEANQGEDCADVVPVGDYGPEGYDHAEGEEERVHS